MGRVQPICLWKPPTLGNEWMGQGAFYILLHNDRQRLQFCKLRNGMRFLTFVIKTENVYIYIYIER